MSPSCRTHALTDFEGSSFTSHTEVWMGEAQIGPNHQAAPAHLTYSFPRDGTLWGLRSEPVPFNNLNATLKDVFGEKNLDLGREYIRQAIAAWGIATGVTYTEVADDGSPMDEDPTRVSTRGDIRIGGLDFDPSTIAYNGFPVPVGNAEGGGDMVLNSFFFQNGQFMADPFDSYRYFRNIVAHEHGHGLGYFHVAPCIGHTMQLLLIPPGDNPVGIDEWRGGGRNYGDRLAPNHTQAEATSLLQPSVVADLVRSDVVLRSLALNGANGPNGTNEDWFTFGVPRNSSLTVSVSPIGGEYEVGDPGENCALICPVNGFAEAGGDCLRNAQQAGNLALELHDRNGLVQAVDAGGLGDPETLVISTGGQYWLRVHDVGPNPAQDLTVQLYDLELRTPFGKARPWAVAGLDKRIPTRQKCHFIGDLLSTAQEDGATLVRYDWDLNGDGVFEVLDDPRPVTEYRKIGTIPVTLRVVDSHGRVDTDTVQVTVHPSLSTSDPVLARDLSDSTHDLTTQLYAITSDDGDTGMTVTARGGPPWQVNRLAQTQGWGTLRIFGKYLYAMEVLNGTIRRIKRDGEQIQVYDFGEGSEPQDLLLVSKNEAFVTRKGSTWLHRLNLTTGDGVDVVDLGQLAGQGQEASLRTMIRDGKRVFIQVQLRNLGQSAVPQGDGGVLAVYDLSEEELLDVDPLTPGIQGVALQGAPPRLKMQILGRTLYVSTTDSRLDDRGGIEMVNLDTLQSVGYALSEETISDLGAFVMTSAEGGYFVFHTDIVPSTHLKPFTINGGVPPGPEIFFMLGDFVDSLAFDPSTKRLFLPSGFSTFGLTPGVYVFDATTDEMVGDGPIDTGMMPHDVVLE